MEVTRLVPAVAIALCVVLSAPVSIAQASHSNYDPAARKQSAKRPQNFVDFTLKRINPADRDYGQCLSESRDILLDEAVKTGYFWSNLVALGILGCLFIVIVWQHRIQTRREWGVSEILAQYERALARSNQQVEEATKRNCSLAASLTALKTPAVPGKTLPAEQVDAVSPRAVRSHTAATLARAATASKEESPKIAVERSAPMGVHLSPNDQIALFKPEVELVSKVNALEQQLGRSHELERQLRRQLNETGRKLQAEQERNRTQRSE